MEQRVTQYKLDRILEDLKRLVGEDTLYYNTATCKFEVQDEGGSRIISTINFPDLYVIE